MCCGLLHTVALCSKKMTTLLNLLRKNHEQYQGLLKFRDFKKAFSREVLPQ
jgi:hypothetical protein